MSNEELVERIQTGELELMTNLYEQNIGLLYQMARKYRQREPMDDLMQQAYLGLHEAALRYNAAAGASFSSYAVYWIKQSLHWYLENCGRVIRIPVSEQALYYQYMRYVEHVRKVAGRSPTDEEILRYLGITEKRLQSIKMNTREIDSLDSQIADEDDITLGETVSDKRDPYERILDIAEEKEHRAVIDGQMKKLPKEQRIILRLLHEEKMTVAAVGQIMGISSSEVRTLTHKAYRYLRHNRVIKRCAEERGVI